MADRSTFDREAEVRRIIGNGGVEKGDRQRKAQVSELGCEESARCLLGAYTLCVLRDFQPGQYEQEVVFPFTDSPEAEAFVDALVEAARAAQRSALAVAPGADRISASAEKFRANGCVAAHLRFAVR